MNSLLAFGRKYRLPIALCFVAALVIFSVSQAAAIKRQLNNWKLLPQPERLTELYYENHTKLPTTYTPGTQQSFTFTVHNLEYRTTSYSYTVTQKSEDGTQSQQLSSGSFTLNQNAFKTQTISIAPTDLGGRVQIETSLLIGGPDSSTEAIHYWVTRNVERAS